MNGTSETTTSPTADGQGWRPIEGMKLRHTKDGASATIWWVEGLSAYVKFDDGRYGTYVTQRFEDRLGDSMYINANFEPLPSPPTSGQKP